MICAVHGASDRAPFTLFPVTTFDDRIGRCMGAHAAQIATFDSRIAVIGA
jgi:hypothetical protein